MEVCDAVVYCLLPLPLSLHIADGNASTNALMMGAVYPGFNDTRVPAYWNGGNTRLIARNVAEGTPTRTHSARPSCLVPLTVTLEQA